MFRLDQDRINSLSYEQQVGCGEYVAVVVAHTRSRACWSLVRVPLCFFFVFFSPCFTLLAVQFKIAEFIGAIRGALERGVNEGGVVTEEMVS